MTRRMRRTMQEFQAERAEGQARLLATDHLGIKRFLRLDAAAYEDGALTARTKELLGLVASLVLRCDDCINYHVQKCAEAGYTKDEIADAMNVGLIVGGSICIPHVRRALLALDDLDTTRTSPPPPPGARTSPASH